MPALLAAVASGDRTAHEVLEVAGERIGVVLAGVVNAIGPGVIVLGGELARAGEALLAPVGRALDAHVLPLARDGVTLRTASLGEAGGARGGVALALHESPLLARYPGPEGPEQPEDDV